MKGRHAAGLLGAAIATSLLPAAAAIPSATAASCPDIQVVFARGTSEPAGVGAIGQAFIDSLRSQVGGRDVGVYAVNYPATDDFVNSAAVGRNDARAHVESMASDCPNTRMVLGGYSQGATVMDGVTATAASTVADHVAAVAVFGNPTSAFSSSLAGGLPVAGIAPSYSGKTIDLCVPGDPICSDGTNFLAHIAYVQVGMTDQAATYAAGRL